MRPDAVDQHMAGNSAPYRPAERVDHLAPDRIVGEDVAEDPNVMFGGIDVGDQPGNAGVIILDQLEAVAADRRQVAEPLGKFGDFRDFARHCAARLEPIAQVAQRTRGCAGTVPSARRESAASR